MPLSRAGSRGTAVTAPAPNGRGPFSVRTLAAVIALGVAISVLFIAFPQIDLWASALFVGPNGGFPLLHDPWAVLVRQLVLVSIATLSVLAVGTLLLKLLFGRYRSPIALRAAVYLIVCLVLAPGLVVNSLLKDQWGRPRPVHLETFAVEGSEPTGWTFTRPWVISDQCPSNCSFVSGEASAGFVLIALAPLTAMPWTVAVLGTLWGLVVSAVRVIQGGHFLSDVLLAGVVTYCIVWAVYWLIFVRRPSWLSEQSIEDRIGSLRHAVQTAWDEVWLAWCRLRARRYGRRPGHDDRGL